MRHLKIFGRSDNPLPLPGSDPGCAPYVTVHHGIAVKGPSDEKIKNKVPPKILYEKKSFKKIIIIIFID